MVNLLVTGGAGFIGSNFIRYYMKKHPDANIVNYDKLTYAGNMDNLKDIEMLPNYKFVKGDICDKERVDQVIKLNKITHIVHFAAETHVDRSITDPSSFVMTNVVGTHVLLDAALNNNIVRFHHVSTDEVFGALDLEDGSKFQETTLYNPRSPYSASKAASDHLVKAYFHTFGLPVTVSNCSNNFGPFQNPEKFLPRAITNLIDGECIPIYGDGKYVRDWVHVEDHCSAIDMILENGKPGETYLVGGMTKDVNNLEISMQILKLIGKDKKFLKRVKDRPGHDRRYAMDWTKINKELGWKPKFEFEKWLEKTVDWYKDNDWWWRPLKDEAEKLYTKTGQK